MSVGILPTKDQLDNNGGGLLKNVENAIAQCEKINVWLLATPDATLLAAPYGYAQAEINTLKSAFADMAILGTVYRGTATQGSLKDFRTFAKLLWGFGL